MCCNKPLTIRIEFEAYCSFRLLSGKLSFQKLQLTFVCVRADAPDVNFIGRQRREITPAPVSLTRRGIIKQRNG
jgi:hypothetical protein